MTNRTRSKRYLVHRLENWARWARVTTVQGKSMTAIYCDALRESRTGSVYDEPQVALPPIDEDDAQVIEKHVANLRISSRDFLRKLYVFRSPHAFLCRRFGIPHRPMLAFDLFSIRIENELANSLDKGENTENNRGRLQPRRSRELPPKGELSLKTTEDVD